MCGIAGIWRVDSQKGATLRRLDAGLDAIAHRGPDDSGIAQSTFAGGTLALGSVRLAILDLTAAGHMPMDSHDGRYSLVYNGEITNFVEIRGELEMLGRVFDSGSDTEVLLQAWEVWGAECLQRFEGMFAFAMLDRLAERLVLVRDSFGIKPLYYSYANQELIFCSELPGLLKMMSSRPRLDWQTALEYLQFGVYDRSARTFVEGVSQLEPAHLLTIDLHNGRVGEPHRYWWPSIEENDAISFAEASEVVRERFLASVSANLRSDVPLGIALSGGVDSSAIAAGVRRIAPDHDIVTFSFVARGAAESEEKWANLVAESVEARAFTVAASGRELHDDLNEMIRIQGEPFRSTSIYAQYRVFQLAREQGVVVTLDGQGADEAFGGYHGYPAQRVRSLADRGRFVEANGFLREWAKWPGRSLRSGASAAIAEFVPRSIAVALESRRRGRSIIDVEAVKERGASLAFPREDVPTERGRRMSAYLRWQLMVRGLPSLLRHGDRNAMAFSIESRVPFLDRGLVEFALSLPESFLVSGHGETKRVLRAALRGIVPQAVLDRRDKVGFETPEDKWLEEFVRSPGSDDEEPIGFLPGNASGDSDPKDLGLGGGGSWRYINLRRWVTIFGIDAT